MPLFLIAADGCHTWTENNNNKGRRFDDKKRNQLAFFQSEITKQ